MKLIGVDETKGWQYTTPDGKKLLQLPDEKLLIDPEQLDTGLPVFPLTAYDLNTCYDAGIYQIGANSTNYPSGSSYGSLLVMTYRQKSGNTIPDYAVQIYLPNGDDTTKPNSMFYRTSLANAWNPWIEVQKNRHIHVLYLINSDYRVLLQVEDGSATPFTIATLKTFLYWHGFNSANGVEPNIYPATGGHRSINTRPVWGISTNGTSTGNQFNVTTVQSDGTYHTTQTFTEIHDTVISL